jgi:2-hydroxychromene-2-carboxylate isomerase
MASPEDTSITETIDYYFSLASPWAYLGHAPFMGLAVKYTFKVHFKPVFLPEIFNDTGGVPLAKRHPARQRYRLVELQRWRVKRGIDQTIHPRHVPFDTRFADRTILAAAMLGHDPDAYIRLAFAGVWTNDINLGDHAVIEGLLRRAGLDPVAIMNAADSPMVTSAYQQHVEDAIAVGVIGGPSYVRQREVFWGQDRLDLLEDAVTSGRAAFQPIEK